MAELNMFLINFQLLMIIKEELLNIQVNCEWIKYQSTPGIMLSHMYHIWG